MCGFLAALGINGVELSSQLQAATNLMAHRGPDGSGFDSDSWYFLGHRRLSIIDVAGGSQPFICAKSGSRLVYNGELYNYRELRAELIEAGDTFHTHGDTEVVLRALIRWGTDALSRFHGMFALCFLDKAKGSAILARDQFGEKPLFIARGPNGTIVAASEIRAIRGSKLCHASLNHDGLVAYLALGYIPTDRSIWSTIAPIPPGHYVVWTSGSVESGKYYEPPTINHESNPDDWIEQIQSSLEKSIRRQMVADAPIGIFLSGGLDSSTITILAQRASSKPISTFSVGFGDDINELPYAEAVAASCGTKHHSLQLKSIDAAQSLEQACRWFDEPFSDSSMIPTGIIASFASQQVKVCLGGDGGDEMLGGYWWHPIIHRAEQIHGRYIWWLTCRVISRIIRHKNTSLANYSCALGFSARWPDAAIRSLNANRVFSNREICAVLNSDRLFSLSADLLPNTTLRGTDRMLQQDIHCYLPGNILRKIDGAGMAHSLEIRAPFLDRLFSDAALSIPAIHKFKAWRGKILLEKAFANHWPIAIRNRKKQGFGGPIARWLKQPGMICLEQDIHANTLFRSLLPGLKSHSSYSTQQRWSLLCLGLWLRNNSLTW